MRAWMSPARRVKSTLERARTPVKRLVSPRSSSNSDAAVDICGFPASRERDSGRAWGVKHKVPVRKEQRTCRPSFLILQHSFVNYPSADLFLGFFLHDIIRR